MKRGAKMKHGYTCQFCQAKSLAQSWAQNTCPKCKKVYDQSVMSVADQSKLVYFVEAQESQAKED